jgi:hypothetical protein
VPRALLSSAVGKVGEAVQARKRAIVGVEAVRLYLRGYEPDEREVEHRPWSREVLKSNKQCPGRGERERCPPGLNVT